MNTSLRPISRLTVPPNFLSAPTSSTYICQPCRYARLLRRPKRPYTFTQLVTLSDGSAFTIRTTSPLPVYRSTRDTRNSPLWNPSSKELLNVEDDEAGRLAGFRARFGRSFDSSKGVSTTTGPRDELEGKLENVDGGDIGLEEDEFGENEDANIIDLISSYGNESAAEKPKKSDKKWE